MPKLEHLNLSELQRMADKRLELLDRRQDKDAWDRASAYIELFYNDRATLVEFIEDFNKGVYN